MFCIDNGAGQVLQKRGSSLLNSLATLKHMYRNNIFTIHDNKKRDKMFLCQVWLFPNCVSLRCGFPHRSNKYVSAKKLAPLNLHREPFSILTPTLSSLKASEHKVLNWNYFKIQVDDQFHFHCS